MPISYTHTHVINTDIQYTHRKKEHTHTLSAWVELIFTRVRWNGPFGVRTEGCERAHRSSLVAFNGPVV